MQRYDDLITRNLYSTDASMFRVMPSLVVEPENVEDVASILREAHERKLAVGARGAGTGLAGDSLTDGISLDFSVYFDRILSIDPERKRVVLQPGVVYAELNKQLKTHGLIFGPDPATGNRATIGGMLANNSTGAHSLRYGMSMQWVRSLKVMLADGSVHLFSTDCRSHITHPGLVKVLELLEQHAELIELKWPDTPRNRHGYLLKDILQGDLCQLYRLFVGSEGTLGIILEIELEVSKIPAHTKLLCLCFDSRMKAAQAADPLLHYNPSAVEIIDSICLDMARTNPLYASYFPKTIDSILMVELDGDDVDEMEKRRAEIIDRFVRIEHLATQVIVPKNDKEQADIWQMRKLIAGMMNKVPGKYLPIPVIEDVCIHPRFLPQYFAKVDEILSARGLRFLCFGHAGDGTVHIRPFLNLRSADTYEWLPEVCEEVYNYTMEIKGTISGEHGDGYLRAPFLKLQYGELFDVFKEIKQVLDPHNVLNPDKQTGCIDFSRWTHYHKYCQVDSTYRPIYQWRVEKLIEMSEACNGCGECRSKMKERDMCPMFRAYSREVASTRAKANTMRAWLYGELEGVAAEDLKKLAQYCINCKRCESDCPSGVRAGDLMLEFKALAGADWQESLLCQMEKGMRLGASFPRLSNFFSQKPFIRMMLEKSIGLDARRLPPKFSLKPFRQELHHYRTIDPKAKHTVVYFMDSFAELMEGESARSFIKIMKALGVAVVIPPQVGSGIVNLNYGDKLGALNQARNNIKELLPYLNRGMTVICSEPSACLMLKEEYGMLLEGEGQQKLHQQVTDAMSFIHQLLIEEKQVLSFKAMPMTVGYHCPCHAKSITTANRTLELLKMIPELKVHFIDKGCCGIAGTFGMRKKNMDISLQIGSDLIDALKVPAIDMGASECSTCRLQMEHGSGKKCLHPLEIIAQAIS